MPESFQPYHERVLKKPKPPLHESQLPREKERGEMMIYQGHSAESYASHLEAINGSEARECFETVLSLTRALQEAGGRALLVGGCVRDEVLGMTSKDFDMEVYGLTPDAVEPIMKTFGKVDAVGKAFGILKLSRGGMDIDVSFPRTDSKVGNGHKGIEVKIDLNMSVKEAARRRDFTFNALAKDPLTGEIFDAFGGVEDLRNRKLRVTDAERFQDDPLRLMRAAQFVGRFGLHMDPESHQLMESMVLDLKDLPRERIKEEWEKLLLKSERPSLALLHLDSLGVMQAYFPELHALHGTQQEFEWHPEGDVWIHTLMVVDAAADVAREHRVDAQTKRVILWAALCHDLGKPATTTFEDGRLRSRGHEPAGEEPTRVFLERLGMDHKTTSKVIRIVKEHLWPGMAFIKTSKGEEITDGAFRKLAKRISPATIAELTYTSEADSRGRGPFLDPNHREQLLLPTPYEAGTWVRKRAQELGVEKEIAPPILQGRDLIALGFRSGKIFGEIIAAAEHLRDERNYSREQVLGLLMDFKQPEDALERLRFELPS